MKKIPTLFVRDLQTRLVIPAISEGCGWVEAGEGRATRKHNGTACLVKDGRLWRRYTVKKGKPCPADFVAAGEVVPPPLDEPLPGWVPVRLVLPADKWHLTAFRLGGPFQDGTYELVGPKVQGNPEGLDTHHLIRHGSVELPDAPRTFYLLKDYLGRAWVEGVVWHHPDGRMAKIKTRDFWGVERKTV